MMALIALIEACFVLPGAAVALVLREPRTALVLSLVALVLLLPVVWAAVTLHAIERHRHRSRATALIEAVRDDARDDEELDQPA